MTEFFILCAFLFGIFLLGYFERKYNLFQEYDERLKESLNVEMEERDELGRRWR